MISEVLSESTEKHDRTVKLALYRSCPSVQEYILIATEYRAVEVFRRAQPRWTYERYGPEEAVELESLDLRQPVSQLYRLTDVPDAPSAARRP